MAARKTPNNSNPRGAQIVVIFWLLFVIVIVIVFMLNAETIERNFNILKTRLVSPSGAEENPLENGTLPEGGTSGQPPGPAVVAVEPSSPNGTGSRIEPEKPGSGPAQTSTQTQPATQAPARTTERTVYFAQIGKDGQILQSKTARRIPVSDSPMVDALSVMFSGPTADELGRGVINFVPGNTRLISATVRGSTAYLNFSEDFLFNTYGVEGYVAQLRQIVWTVTEFSNVNDVQILVEGRRLDYLGEGIWIGSPISRQSF